MQISRTRRKPHEGLSKREMRNLIDLADSGVPLDSLRASGMHPIHRQKLRLHRVELLKDIDAITATDHLLSKNILSEEDKNDILAGGTLEGKNRILLEKLPKKGPKAYGEFRKYLVTNCSWFAEDLDDTVVTAEDLGYTSGTLTSPPPTPASGSRGNSRPLSARTQPRKPAAKVSPLPGGSKSSRRPAKASTPLGLPITRPVGVLDFDNGIMKEFHADTKTWKETGVTIHQDLWQENLGWIYRVCAEGGGKVYLLNTRDMVLHCLDVASRQWAETRQVDTSYRAVYAAMTYSNGRLYVSGGRSLDTKVRQNTLVSLIVAGGGKSRVSVQQEPDMLYRRGGHGMAGVGGRVLVCGGVGGDTDIPLASIEVFDLGTRTWTRLTDMPEASWSFGLIPTATAVFVLGGITRYLSSDVSPTLSDTVSVFDWQTRQWNPLPRLPMPLCNIQAAYRGGSLWLLAAVTGQRKDENDPATAFTDRLECVLEYDVSQQTSVTHHNIPALGINGMDAYTFPLLRSDTDCMCR